MDYGRLEHLGARMKVYEWFLQVYRMWMVVFWLKEGPTGAISSVATGFLLCYRKVLN